MHNVLETVAGAGVEGGRTPHAEAWSARAWFAGGERIGYDPRFHAIVASEDAPLRIFLRREGDPAHAVSSPKTTLIRPPSAPILSKRSGGCWVSSQRRWSHSTFPRLSFWSSCDAGLSARHRANPPAGRTYAVSSFSMAGSSRTGTHIRGTPHRCCAASPTKLVAAWAGRSPFSRGCRE